MKTDKTVLLARPHPFIEKAMTEILMEAEFAPAVVGSLEGIKTVRAEEYAGVVISTSVLSSTKEHYLEVFKALRKHLPGTPILFATLVDLEQMAPMLEKSLKSIEPMSRVATLENAKEIQGYCEPMTYFLIHKSQLSDPQWKGRAIQLIRRHFS